MLMLRPECRLPDLMTPQHTATLQLAFATLLSLIASMPARSDDPPVPQVPAGVITRIGLPAEGPVPARPVDIWLPADYRSQPQDQRYAVLYMHDGQMLFDDRITWNGQSWNVAEVAQRLQDEGDVQPFIVVGIHNAGEARHAEYFPQAVFESLPDLRRQQLLAEQRAEGQPLFTRAPYADAYLDHLVHWLKPYIDSHFHTNPAPEATYIAGSSMGGLISWYALTRYPTVFGGMTALSTHWPGTFSVEDNPIPDAFLEYMKQNLPDPGTHRLYFDYGDATLDALYPPLQQAVDDVLRKSGYAEPDWHTSYFPGAEHSERAWAERLDQPLHFLLEKR